MLKGCVQNSKREFADLAVGMAVFTGQIRQLVLPYREWCLIDNSSPNSLFAVGTVLPLPSFSGSLEPVLAAQFGLVEQRYAHILAEQFGAQYQPRPRIHDSDLPTAYGLAKHIQLVPLSREC